MRLIRNRNRPLKCEECGGKRVRDFKAECNTGPSKRIIGIKWPLTLEHANVAPGSDGSPMTFKNPTELRKHCRKYGIASGALL